MSAATHGLVARYDDKPVPRGTSRRWEVILADEDRARAAQQLSASDIRAQHRILQQMSGDDLSRMPLLPEGERLARFRAYVDLHDPGRADFVAEGSEVVKPGQRIVAKNDVDREVWSRLVQACHEVAGWRRRRTA